MSDKEPYDLGAIFEDFFSKMNPQPNSPEEKRDEKLPPEIDLEDLGTNTGSNSQRDDAIGGFSAGIDDVVENMGNLGSTEFSGTASNPGGKVHFSCGQRRDPESEFETQPGPKIYTRRPVALISMHPDTTKYLESINPKVRPLELPIQELQSNMDFDNQMWGYTFKGADYGKEDWKDRLREFSLKLNHRYGDVEQVYALSKYSFLRLSNISFGLPQHFFTDPREDFEGEFKDKLGDTLFKRLLILPYAPTERRAVLVPHPEIRGELLADNGGVILGHGGHDLSGLPEWMEADVPRKTAYTLLEEDSPETIEKIIGASLRFHSW